MNKDQKIYQDVASLLYEHFKEEYNNIHFLMYLGQGFVDTTFFYLSDSNNVPGLNWEFDERRWQIQVKMTELRQIYIENGWGEWNVVHCSFDPITPDIEFDFEQNKALREGSIAFHEYFSQRFKQST
ncbi:MAG: hypothetical protein C9356_18250 [Oleiphilus sp.]|nr:MAG: hypothetical protein C9356_18250 [Oleiphilus sp.]